MIYTYNNYLNLRLESTHFEMYLRTWKINSPIEISLDTILRILHYLRSVATEIGINRSGLLYFKVSDIWYSVNELYLDIRSVPYNDITLVDQDLLDQTLNSVESMILDIDHMESYSIGDGKRLVMSMGKKTKWISLESSRDPNGGLNPDFIQSILLDSVSESDQFYSNSSSIYVVKDSSTLYLSSSLFIELPHVNIHSSVKKSDIYDYNTILNKFMRNVSDI